ncbi:MAG: hypothetical protein KA914_11715 [Ottowia sp.]|jgi:hypothetical protein|nr:hypothetical protein [Ottowia sp.]
MEKGELFWLAPRAVRLPYRPRAMDTVPEALQGLVDCGNGAQALLWQLDWAHLCTAERSWLEGGEDLPAIGFHWLDRAATLMRVCAQNQQTVAIIDVPTRRLTQLAISDLMRAMGGDAWLGEGLVALVWGFAREALLHPKAVRWPLACRGAVFPSGDGLHVGWWAPSVDIAKYEQNQPVAPAK